MGCNCKDMEGFELAMFKAQAFERKTGKKAAVFVVDEKTPSFTELSNINKVKGICCYFTTDGKEVEIVDVKEIEVTEAKVVESKKRRTSKK